MMGIRFQPFDWIWLALYVALLAAVVLGLLEGRRRALAAYGTDEAQSQWDTWREDAKEQAEGKGPVARRVPKSAEPPALVLMRDYFAVCLVIAAALSSVLFGTLVLFIRGAMSTPSTFVDRSPPDDRYDTSTPR